MVLVTRAWLVGVLLLAASAAQTDPADTGFIGSPLPANTSPVSSTAGADPALEIERAERAVRQRLEEHRLDQRGSRAAIEAYRARETRVLDVETLQRQIDAAHGIGATSDAERVRADIDRAREKLELDRRLERIAPTRP